MKKFCLTLLFCFSIPAFSQDPGSETVTVEASRITTTPFGPVFYSGPDGRPHACIDPTCGGTVDPVEPGGERPMSLAQKAKSNKSAKDKAKQNQGTVKDSMKSDWDLMASIGKWFSGITASLEGGGNFWFKYTRADGMKFEGGGCGQYHSTLNKDDPEYKNPCIERKADTQLIQKANGGYENQLNLTYTIYDTCYFEKTCRPIYITYIAGSMQELYGLLNESIGEDYFH